MRIDVHSDRAFTVKGLLTSQECGELVQLAESQGFESAQVRTVDGQQALPHIRNNERAMFPAARWTELLWSRLRQVELPRFGQESAQGLPRDLRFYKYHAGQRFKMHKDGPWKESGLTSRLTFLVYLNDDFEGGDTDFREFRVRPEAGAALLFVHETWHEGAAVEAGVKYVARSDVLYG